jgi:hypothetical protein
MATGFGAKPVRKLQGGELRTRAYVAAATEGSVLCQGEFVELDGAIDSKTGLPTVKLATAGNALLGVVVGMEADPTDPLNGDYRKASTRRVMYICDDPDAIFQIQEDAVGGSVSAANIAVSANADIIVSAGTSTTRISGTMLDSSTATTSSANLKIVGIVRDDVNTAAQSGGAVLEVMIFEHALKTADSQT